MGRLGLVDRPTSARFPKNRARARNRVAGVIKRFLPSPTFKWGGAIAMLECMLDQVCIFRMFS